jgi:hypothetical protein
MQEHCLWASNKNGKTDFGNLVIGQCNVATNRLLSCAFFVRSLVIDLVGIGFNETKACGKSLIFLYAAASENRLNNRCDPCGNVRKRFSGVAPRMLLLRFHPGQCIRVAERLFSGHGRCLRQPDITTQEPKEQS